MAQTRTALGGTIAKNPQRQLSSVETSPAMRKPSPAPISSPDRISPKIEARSRAGKKSPVIDATQGQAAATIAPSARRASSRNRYEVAMPQAIIAAAQLATA